MNFRFVALFIAIYHKKIETGLLGAYPPKSLSHFTIY